jgi:Replication protein
MKGNKKRWRLQREARRILANVRVMRVVKTGPNKGKFVAHSFAVCDCCRSLVNQGKHESDYLVQVLRSKDSGRAFFGNVKRCASVWTCPVCAARITERRRKEVQEGLNNWKAQGGKVFLLTLTLPHHKGKTTQEWLDQLLLAYRKMRNRSSWRKWREHIGCEGSIRALEVTYPKTGASNNDAHVHIHLLLLCKITNVTIPPQAAENSDACEALLWKSASFVYYIREYPKFRPAAEGSRCQQW